MATIFFSLIAQAAYASMPNYNSVIVGEQAAGMGGAYTALSEDVSALSWYNPATIAWLKEQAFSASVGIYKKYDTNYNKTTSLVDSAFQSNQGYFKPIAASTANIVRFKDEKFEISKIDLLEYTTGWTFAFSILVPYSDQYKGTINNANNDQSTLNVSDEHLWVGGSMARTISSDSSVGYTIYYTSRSLNKSVNDTTYVNAGNFTVYTEERTYKQNALVLILGYNKIVNERWKHGVSVRLPGLSIFGRGTFSENTITNAGYTPVAISEVEAKTVVPAKLAYGIAYQVPNRYTIAMDLNYYPGGYSYSDIDKASAAEEITLQDVLNASIGGEYYWNEHFKIRSGVFTNFSAYPNPNPAKSKGLADHVDQLGFSANLALVKGNIQYTFGGYYTGGWGQSVQRINQAYSVVPKTQNVFTMLVGTTYLY